MKIEEFSKKLIDNIFLGANRFIPFDSSVFLEHKREEIMEISGIGDFEIIHIELPGNNILCDGFLMVEDKGVLYVMLCDTTKNKDKIEEITSSQVQRLIKSGSAFVQSIFKNEIKELIDESEEDQLAAADLIFNNRLEFNQIKFLVISNKRHFNDNDRLYSGSLDKKPYSTVVISLHDFYDFWKTKSSDFIAPKIDFKDLGYNLPFISLPQQYESYNGYLVVMNALALYEIYDEYETDLLQSNVRFFLKATRKQNKGLLETLGGDDRDKFFAYNNGISATADKVEFFESEDSSFIKYIDNFQIVNGGQTTATIHYFGSKSKENREKLKHVYLQMKLNVIRAGENSEGFVQDISRYANTQSTVYFSDLDANDSFNVEFEKHSKSVSIPHSNGEKWFYERKAGSYDTSLLNLSLKSTFDEEMFKKEFKKHRKVKKTELAIILFAWGFINENSDIEPRPYDSALGGEKNYLKFKTFKDNHEINVTPQFYMDSISKIILARAIADLVNEAGIKQQRNHIVNYTMGFLALKCKGIFDFESVWSTQGISEELRRDLFIVVKKVWNKIQKSAGLINISTWARKSECWLEIKKVKHNLNSSIPEISFFSQPTEDNKEKVTAGGDAATKTHLSFSKSLEDSSFWFGLASWAKKENKLDGWSRKFSFTIGRFISQGKEITVKQLPIAHKLFDKAVAEGYINNEQDNNVRLNNLKYYKLICNQDIERNPSVSVDAVENFFKLTLANGENTWVDIYYRDELLKTEINKRQTRNEYRIFLNRHEDLRYKTDDIFEFSKSTRGYEIEIIKKGNHRDSLKNYISILEKLNGKLHAVT